MVKSYQGVRKAVTKEVQMLLVEEYMSVNLITFRQDQSIEDVVKVLLAKKISGGPVLNDQGELVGIISEGDCLKEIVRGKYSNSPNHGGTVEDHMVREVKIIAPDVNVIDAARMFLDLRVRRFPVIKEGKLIGQVSQRDVLRAVQTLLHETW